MCLSRIRLTTGIDPCVDHALKDGAAKYPNFTLIGHGILGTMAAMPLKGSIPYMGVPRLHCKESNKKTTFIGKLIHLKLTMPLPRSEMHVSGFLVVCSSICMLPIISLRFLFESVERL